MQRLLIANRGEIAVRIARTARRMGIDTVGVFSDADRGALHTRSVDLAVALGGTTPAESYLDAEAVLSAALREGCDAVHPGYGFLSENAGFARAVESAGLVWVGPTPAQIELLGDKVAAKRTAVEAGVPTTSAVVVTPDDLPDDLPMPALVKAAAGGGGRGMRVVRSADGLAEVVAAASREAEAAFGDGTVFVEPLVTGRHVEVQVFGDHHGNVVHLGERECSIQRRNQKVLEEAPANIDDATRTLLCDGALALARHVGYRNAGTVEFMVGSGEGGPLVTFLEVNTRLQVEHPVTEAVTGLDLVELQIRIARGEELPFGQDDVMTSGHAIEVRLVAEDHDWVPATGTLAAFEVPDVVRTDSGVAAGSVVTPDYDSLLAKVISHAPTRAEAAAVLARALRDAEVVGVTTNADRMADVLGEEHFLAGDTTTAYLDEHAVATDAEDRLAMLAAVVLRSVESNVWGFAPPGWRNVPTQGQRSQWCDERGETVGVEYLIDRHVVRMWVGDWPRPDAEGALTEDTRREVVVRLDEWGVELDGVYRTVSVTRIDDEHHARARGRSTWRRVPRFADHDAAAAGAGPVSPLPGAVVSVHVAVGDEVHDGDLLVVVEAMKMEHRIVAHGDGTVTEVRVAPGDKVAAGDLLVCLD